MMNDLISKKLQQKFKLLEMIAFQVWQKATPVERERICRELGEYEARETIKEIQDFFDP